MSCGAEVTYARTTDGHVYAWGFGENMQLGNGLGVDDETPSLLTPALLEGQALEVCSSGMRGGFVVRMSPPGQF